MKNYKFILSVKILLLVILLTAGFYFLLIEHNIIIVSVALLIAILLFKSIFDQLDRTNKDLTRFLQSIKYSDFSQTFSRKKLGKSYDELNDAFNEVMDQFRKTRREKEEQHRYLQTVIRHVGVGLIAFDTKGKIEFINPAAKKILRIGAVSHLNIIDQLDKSLSVKLIEMNSGERSTIKLFDESDVVQLFVYVTVFKMREKFYKLVSLQNIQSELEEKELEAWQKLIRVLTHEIMNSVTPISSLSSTINQMLTNNSPEELNNEQITDIKSAVDTIHRRSDGLIEFVENYRNLTKIPKPNFEIILIASLFDRIEKLLSKDLFDSSIKFEKHVHPGSLELTADVSMIEQVLINLIINSTHALKNQNDRRIRLSAVLSGKGRILIKVTDNGPGIQEDVIEKIFIPFFSTKSHGSGIGLSLARQIMRAHKGNIRVVSKPSVETTFTLIF